MKRSYCFTNCIALLLLFFVASCDDSVTGLLPNPPLSGGDQPNLSIPVRFTSTLPLVGYQDKASRAPDNIPEELVTDIWTFQFDGDAPTARLLGEPRYTELTAGAATLPFFDSKGATHTIVFIANTHNAANLWNMVPGRTTLKELLDFRQMIPAEKPTYSPLGLLMSGLYQGQVTAAAFPTGLTQPLTRSVAKIELTLAINAAAAGLTVHSVQLCRVPSYLSPTESLHTSRPTIFPDPVATEMIDYSALTDADITMPTAGGASTSFQWYVPTNLQGTVANTERKLKTLYAPPAATYFKILATDATGAVITYTLYPGADLTSDYNLRANHRYSLALTIAGAGDPLADSRVQNFANVDYTARSLSNCYILNPPPLTNVIARRTYKIPVGRVDQYWGDVQYVGAGAQTQFILGASQPWSVALYWQDNDNLVRPAGNDHITLSKAAGVGKNDYFELTVPAGVPQGNFLIAISKGNTFNPDEILWSWHFWVTDYNPYVALTPIAGRYSYAVPGGELHRYEGTIWKGEYANKFIMDRNLGSFTATQYPSNKGIIHYQFGRKDPIPGGYALYDVNGVALGSGTTPAWVQTNANQIVTSQKIRFSIANPLRIIGNGNQWVNDVMYNELGENTGQTSYDNGQNGVSFRIWHDPKIDQSATGSAAKSIFDPSPWGFKVPKNGVWDDFKTNTSTTPTTNVNGNVARVFARPFSVAKGVYYWPYLQHGGAYPVEGTIFYPAQGYRASNSGSYTSVYTLSAVRTSMCNQPGSAHNLYFTETTILVQRDSRTASLSVRCIQE